MATRRINIKFIIKRALAGTARLMDGNGTFRRRKDYEAGKELSNRSLIDATRRVLITIEDQGGFRSKNELDRFSLKYQ
jgi:hypothetical protein